MDERPIPQPHKIFDHSPDEPTEGGVSASDPENLSPFSPRPAEKLPQIPASQDRDGLRLATAAILQQRLSFSEAAQKFGVDPDALHMWHRVYTNFIRKDVLTSSTLNPLERIEIEIDKETSQKFDRNWAKMMWLAESEKPQLSPLRQALLRSPLTRWMFRDEKIDKVTVTGAAAVIAFSALAVKAGTSYRGNSDTETDDASPKPIAKFDPSDPQSFGSEQQAAALSKIAKALEQFITLETWQERLPYVRKSDEMKPLMAAYYEDHSDRPYTNFTVNPQVTFINRPDGLFALAQGRHRPEDASPEDSKSIIFLAELTEDDPGVLFDWEVMVNYEPISWPEFVKSRSTAPSPFRVRVRAGDYYNQPFMDEEQFASFALQPLYREKTVHGFVRRGSELAKTLEENLSKEINANRAMILDLRFPENAKYDDIFEIESIVTDSWLGED